MAAHPLQYFEGHPFLTRDAALYLVQAGVALVGIDSLNIDDTGDLARPVHSRLQDRIAVQVGGQMICIEQIALHRRWFARRRSASLLQLIGVPESRCDLFAL